MSHAQALKTSVDPKRNPRNVNSSRWVEDPQQVRLQCVSFGGDDRFKCGVLGKV